MALDERTRHELHQRLDEVLGPDHAVALMSALPPVGEELATYRDLKHELEATTLRLEAALHREIHTAVTSQTRTVLFGVIGTVMATGGTILAGIALAT
jgi:hypothetical protein